MPRRSPTARSTASRRWAAASRCSTAWRTRASTSSSATAPRPPGARRRCVECSSAGVKSLRRHRCDAGGFVQSLGRLSWLVTGRTVGGLQLYPQPNSSTGRPRCGCGPRIRTGSPTARAQRADQRRTTRRPRGAVLRTTSRFREEEIRHIESVLTVVGGKPVYGAQEFAELAPPPPPAMPDWSPVEVYGGYDNSVDCGHLWPSHRIGRCRMHLLSRTGSAVMRESGVVWWPRRRRDKRATANPFRAFRHRDFLRFFIGQLPSASGTFLQQTALGWLVFQQTGSAASLGMVLASGSLPQLLLGPWGGAFADRFDLRRLLLITQVAFAVLAGALWVGCVHRCGSHRVHRVPQRR